VRNSPTTAEPKPSMDRREMKTSLSGVNSISKPARGALRSCCLVGDFLASCRRTGAAGWGDSQGTQMGQCVDSQTTDNQKVPLKPVHA
jgi:hypothetical protein